MVITVANGQNPFASTSSSLLKGHGIQKPMSNISEIGQIWHAKILLLAKSKLISIELWVLGTSIHRFIARRKAPGESSCCCCATSNYEVHSAHEQYRVLCFQKQYREQDHKKTKQFTRTTLRQQHLDNRLKSFHKNDSTDSRNNLPNISLT